MKVSAGAARRPLISEVAAILGKLGALSTNGNLSAAQRRRRSLHANRVRWARYYANQHKDVGVGRPIRKSAGG